ncbi:MAG: alpha/beta hydrolase [Flavobacteriaceae bacterium]|nr:alpha/beta hydrolase [Flavobacteriaceae bacterium]
MNSLLKSICTVLFMIASTSLFAQKRYLDNLFVPLPAVTYDYAVKGKETLKLDFYEPNNDPERKRPLIVFMHGGGFSGGSRNGKPESDFAKDAVKKGYLFASISYRLTRKNKTFNCTTPLAEKMETFHLAAEDLLDALQFLIDRDSTFRIDPTKIILAGSSAGAEAVLSAVYNDDLIFNSQPAYRNFEPAAVLSLAGALPDVRYMIMDNAIPGVFFHGSIDQLVPYDTESHHFCNPNESGYMILDGSRKVVDKLKSFNTSYMLCTFNNLGHEAANIPFEYLSIIYNFFNEVVIKGKFYQAEFAQDYSKKP